MNGSWRSLAKSEGGEREGEEGRREGGLRWGCGGTVAGEGDPQSGWHPSSLAAEGLQVEATPSFRPRRPPFEKAGSKISYYYPIAGLLWAYCFSIN